MTEGGPRQSPENTDRPVSQPCWRTREPPSFHDRFREVPRSAAPLPLRVERKLWFTGIKAGVTVSLHKMERFRLQSSAWSELGSRRIPAYPAGSVPAAGTGKSMNEWGLKRFVSGSVGRVTASKDYAWM